MTQSDRRATHILIVLFALLVAASGPALAQADEGWSVGGGIGLTASPTSFLMQLDLPYHFGNGASVGPQLQIGVTGGTTVVSFAANGRYEFDVSMGDANFISDLRPLHQWRHRAHVHPAGRKHPALLVAGWQRRHRLP